jgi:hypothetical protein
MSYKQVNRFRIQISDPELTTTLTELDALSDLDEGEASYLTEATAVPDFLDEAPHVPANEVSPLPI